MGIPEQFDFEVGTDTCAAAYYADGLQVVALYELEFGYLTPHPCEIRTWRATNALPKKELAQMLAVWSGQVPSNMTLGIGSEEVRGVPVGKIFRAMQSRINQDTLVGQNSFEIPSIEEIEEVITARLIPDDWRNSRDFRSHARELRAIKVYLHSVYAEQSIQPMRAICDSEQVSIENARKIIDQARSHGYLTRADGAVGGTVTDKARICANVMMIASTEAKKEEK
jgi:hypothetical protein